MTLATADWGPSIRAAQRAQEPKRPQEVRMNNIVKPMKVQAFQLSDGRLGNRDDALADMRETTIAAWMDKSDLYRDARNMTAAAFIAKHGDEILHILSETKKALD